MSTQIKTKHNSARIFIESGPDPVTAIHGHDIGFCQPYMKPICYQQIRPFKEFISWELTRWQSSFQAKPNLAVACSVEYCGAVPAYIIINL